MLKQKDKKWGTIEAALYPMPEKTKSKADSLKFYSDHRKDPTVKLTQKYISPLSHKISLSLCRSTPTFEVHNIHAVKSIKPELAETLFTLRGLEKTASCADWWTTSKQVLDRFELVVKFKMN